MTSAPRATREIDGKGRAEALRRFKHYPEYKDSGVEWLGKVPAAWSIGKLKHVAGVRFSNVDKHTLDGEHLVRLCNYVDVYYNDLITDTLDFMEATATPEEIRKFALAKGDVLITKDSESWDDIAIPAYVDSTLDQVLCGYHLAQIRPDPAHILGEYLARAFAAHGIRDQFRMSATGITRYGLSSDCIGNARFPLPPPEEQRAIAVFLDRETARIDALIAKKERLIELLREKRTAVITQAVTRGLDPNVPMNDSGVEWLGSVPAHWQLAPVYARYEVALGKMLDAKTSTGEHLRAYLRNVDVQWDFIDVSELPLMDFHPDEHSRYRLRTGDILVCEGGEVGRTAMWQDQIAECYYQKAIHRLRPLRPSEEPRFLFYVMFSLAHRGIFAASGNPNTIDHLTAVQLRHYRFPFPPLVEQRSIVAFLDGETAKMDSLVSRVRSGIKSLQELRSALISAAVTGKIDVRDQVPSAASGGTHARK